jgi:hypothetical protein
VAIRRKRLEYTVYPPNFDPERNVSFDFLTFSRAKRRAVQLGIGSQIWRAVQQNNRRGESLGGWWDIALFICTGSEFKRVAKGDWKHYARVSPSAR